MPFMNSNSIVLGQVTAKLAFQLKGSVELLLSGSCSLGGRESGSGSYFPLGPLKLHAVSTIILLLKVKKAKHEFSIHLQQWSGSLGKLKILTFAENSNITRHSKPSSIPFWPTPPLSPGCGWKRNPVHPPNVS